MSKTKHTGSTRRWAWACTVTFLAVSLCACSGSGAKHGGTDPADRTSNNAEPQDGTSEGTTPGQDGSGEGTASDDRTGGSVEDSSDGGTGSTDDPGGNASPGAGGPNGTTTDTGGMDTGGMSLVTLRLDPSSVTLVDNGVAPAETAQIRAFATIAGQEREVTSEVTWALDPTTLVDVDAGTLKTRSRGGDATLMARYGNAEAAAAITVRLQATVADPGAPATAPGLFSAPPSGDIVGAADGPLVVYPSNETMFPRNLERVLYQWRAANTLDTFEVRFESQHADVRYYTKQRSWLPSAEVWHWLANTHAGSSLTLSIRGLSSSAPSKVYRSQSVTLYFSGADVPGALYYWSTGAQGVMRATLASESATKFFTDPNSNDDTCVACHTVSRNGRRLAGGYGGEVLRQISVPDRALQIPSTANATAPSYGFGTYSPDASRLLYANKGALTLLDAETGRKISDVTLPSGAFASQPDWSPDGKYVAVAYQVGGKAPGNKQVVGTSLARIPVLANDKFGTPEVLVASKSATDSLYFPSYSPDSRYLAFVRGEGDSKDNLTATLWLVAANGGTPVAMKRLNERVRHQDGVTGIGNSMPTWAPSLKRSEFWLAFSSVRDYGDVLSGVGRDQLWGAAIDPSRIALGQDPSYAAFWMPFQELDEGNHRAYWAIDTEVDCPTTIEICDELDNDCDGVVDENCCVPVAEICGNAKDDNCDGQIDDGCKCVSTETCGNAKDDDCDGRIDEGCACQSTETCGNGKDDDCDGDTDAADDECACVPTAEMCGNAKDDDCDGKVDASDEDCACTPSAELCSNGKDDDCDGKVDANDEDCVCTPSAELCSNGKDDDCDGKVDANDDDCTIVVL